MLAVAGAAATAQSGDPGAGAVRLARHAVHAVRVHDRRILFHVPTTSLFDLDPVGAAVLDLLRPDRELPAAEIVRCLGAAFPPAAVLETLQELRDLGVLDDGTGTAPGSRPVTMTGAALTTVVLNVNTGCNLSCAYCYKEDLATPDSGRRMELDTATRAVELLLREAAPGRRLNVVFFGGEPLTNIHLIREVVAYAERRAREAGAFIDFSVTTNGTLLTDEIVEFLDAHRFGVTVSMDGPKALHDRRRRTIGGQGTYDVVAAKARRLLARYRSRPVGARVTLTAGVTDVVAIHRHLREELGFFEVGFAPVTSGPVRAFNLSEVELAEVFAGLKELGEAYLAAALRGQNIGFSNMHQLMTDLADGTSKVLPCGAGVGLLAVDHAGDLHLCHRFTGSDLPTFGDVYAGVNAERLAGFVASAADASGRPCESCHIRNLCAGGCYHESYARYGDPLVPVRHYCDLMRDWVDFGVSVYAQIMERNPEFFRRHVEPRRAHAA